MPDSLHESVKIPEITDRFANKVTVTLAHYLGHRRFYFSVCPDTKMVDFGPVAGLRCNLCGAYHAWLTLDREEAYELAEKRIPPSVDKFIREQLS